MTLSLPRTSAKQGVSVDTRGLPTEDGAPILNAESTVLRRPHFRVDAGEARFMISRRVHRSLGPDEQALWSAIATPQTLESLRHQLDERADNAVRTLWNAQMIEVVEAGFRPDRRRVLVIEPHADDAALSIGGLMWDGRNECDFTLATIASRSNFTSYYYSDQAYFDTTAITELRQRESQLFTRLIGGTHLNVGMNDAPLRYRDTIWTRADFSRHRAAIAVATSRLATPEEMTEWRARIHGLLSSTTFAELWIPLGGPHADHRMTSAICLDVLTAHPEVRNGRRILLYQEVPYAARFPGYTRDALHRLDAAGYKVCANTHSIDHCHASKLRLISVYGSQFKLEALRQDIDDSAYGTDGRVERFWQLTGFPADVQLAGLLPRSTAARTESESVRKWMSRNSGTERVRVILQIPAGRWTQDLPLLLDRFPRALISVVASPEATVELAPLDHPRLRKEVVPEGKAGWAAAALRIAAKSGVPTLFLVSENQNRIASCMARMWFRCDTVIVHSMERLHEAASEWHA